MPVGTSTASTRTLVVGFVPSPQGRAAIEHAIPEAALRGARLLIVNAPSTEAFADFAKAGDDELATIREQIAAAGVEYELHRPAANRRSPWEQLVAVAEEVDAELIIIGLRRRSPVGKLLLGSNAQQILMEATCPVLAVKASS
jgi:nucleotide-binding universal stress UspA family protein